MKSEKPKKLKIVETDGCIAKSCMAARTSSVNVPSTRGPHTPGLATSRQTGPARGSVGGAPRGGAGGVRPPAPGGGGRDPPPPRRNPGPGGSGSTAGTSTNANATTRSNGATALSRGGDPSGGSSGATPSLRPFVAVAAATEHFDRVSAAVASGTPLTRNQRPVTTYSVPSLGRTERVEVTHEDGWTGVETVCHPRVFEGMCLENLLWTVAHNLGCTELRPHLCANPRTCGLAHWDGKTHGNLCGAALIGACPHGDRCRHVHLAETINIPAEAVVGGGATGGAGTGAPRRRAPAPASRLPERICWKWFLHLAYPERYAECSGHCTYAHGEDRQHIPPEFRAFDELVAGPAEPLLRHLQAAIDEIVKVTTEYERAHPTSITSMNRGVLPAFDKAAHSTWYSLWFRGRDNLRKGEKGDPQALALFGEADNPRERLVWVTALRLQTCYNSEPMAALKSGLVPEIKVIGRTDAVLPSDRCTVCQGGCTCMHGAHVPELEFTKEGDRVVSVHAGKSKAIDLENFNGRRSTPQPRQDLTLDYRAYIAALAAYETNKIKVGEVLSGHVRTARERLSTPLKQRVDELSNRMIRAYTRVCLIPADATIEIRPPVVEAVASVSPTTLGAMPRLATRSPEELAARRSAYALALVPWCPVLAADGVRRAEAARVAEAARAAEAAEAAAKKAEFVACVTAFRDLHAVKPLPEVLLSDAGMRLQLYFEEQRYAVMPTADPGEAPRDAPVQDGTGRLVLFSHEGRLYMRKANAVRGTLEPACDFVFGEFAKAMKDVTPEMLTDYLKTGAIDLISLWTFIGPGMYENWSLYQEQGKPSPWETYRAYVDAQRYYWDTHNIIKVTRKRDKRHEPTKRGKQGKHAHDGEEEQCDEFVVRSELKERYVNFRAYLLNIPKTDVRAGLVGTEEYAALACAEPLLFKDFLEAKTTSGSTVTFASWIQDDAERAAVKAVYDAYPGCYWELARIYHALVLRYAPSITFEQMQANTAAAISYCRSSASRAGGVTFEEFAANQAVLEEYYLKRKPGQTLEEFQRDVAEGWESVVVRGHVPQSTTVPSAAFFSERIHLLKSVVGAMLHEAPAIATLSTVEAMLKHIHDTGDHPFGRGFRVPGDKPGFNDIFVQPTLWDGILFRLAREMVKAAPDAETIRALYTQLPASDDAARDVCGTVRAQLDAIHADEVAAVTARWAAKKGPKSARKEKQAAELAATDANYQRALVANGISAADLWTAADDVHAKSFLPLVARIAEGEEAAVEALVAAITSAEERARAAERAAAEVRREAAAAAAAAAANRFSRFSRLARDADEDEVVIGADGTIVVRRDDDDDADSTDSDDSTDSEAEGVRGKPKNALQTGGKLSALATAKAAAKAAAIRAKAGAGAETGVKAGADEGDDTMARLDRALGVVKKKDITRYISEMKLDGALIIAIGPFPSHEAASPVLSLLRTRMGGFAAIKVNDEGVVEVHLIIKASGGKHNNPMGEKLRMNLVSDGFPMSALIADIAEVMGWEENTIDTRFTLPVVALAELAAVAAAKRKAEEAAAAKRKAEEEAAAAAAKRKAEEEAAAAAALASSRAGAATEEVWDGVDLVAPSTGRTGDAPSEADIAAADAEDFALGVVGGRARTPAEERAAEKAAAAAKRQAEQDAARARTAARKAEKEADKAARLAGRERVPAPVGGAGGAGHAVGGGKPKSSLPRLLTGKGVDSAVVYDDDE